MTSSLRWIVMRSLHSFFSTYLLPLILSIIPSFSLVFKIGSVLMVCLLIGSHLISHFALRLSQSMIPSLHFLLFPVVYPKVPYLAHSFSLSIQLLSARWSQQIPSNIICTLMTTSCTSLPLQQLLLYLLKQSLLPAFNLTCLLTHCVLLFSLLTGSFILLKLLFLKSTMTSSLRWIVVRSIHSWGPFTSLTTFNDILSWMNLNNCFSIH